MTFGRTRQGGRENRNIFENVDVVGELLKTLQYEHTIKL